MRADFAALGVKVAKADEDDEDPDAIDIWDTNWPALLAFLGCETQWRIEARGMSGVMTYLGLDYAGVDVVLRRQGAADAVFDDIRVMELAALEAFGEAAEGDA